MRACARARACVCVLFLEQVTSDRQLNRADLEEISDGSGYIKLRASFQVKKVTSVNVKSAA